MINNICPLHLKTCSMAVCYKICDADGIYRIADKPKEPVAMHLHRPKGRTRGSRNYASPYSRHYEAQGEPTGKTKPCSVCDKVLPLDKDHYYIDRNNKTGFRSDCIKCRKARIPVKPKMSRSEIEILNNLAERSGEIASNL